ncbi:unnamed protein product [Schistocephalus solidus]|uniref:G_PROTEIN_RECEP_F1_2 domain-containing protein n=1 Tax=Schistocephalus solidus TaxID=70667 RepID=A0A0X3NSE3_SCHSO|nr:unnamed protein product [Schistocephalus solidus]
MTHLPVGEHWSFSSTAYLLEDSYLFPAMKSNLGSLPAYSSLQSIARFALLSLPMCSFILALINVVGFTKLVASTHPSTTYFQRLHSGNCLIALCILTMMLSGLLWATVLPRLIHFGAELALTGNVSHAQSTGQIFAAQLPAILTTQTTLRIASIWFSVYILTRQLNSLSAAMNCPGCVVDKVPPSPLQPPGNVLDYDGGRSQYLLQPFLRAARSMHHIFRPQKEKFVDPSDFSHTLQELPCCFRCRMTAQRRQFAEMWSDQGGDCVRMPGASTVSASCRHAYFSQFRQLCPALVVSGCIVGFSMILCIPQIWNYRIHLKKLSSYQQLHSQYTWCVTNNAGSSVYEYILAIVGLLLPSFCLLVLLIFFSYRITQMSLSGCQERWLARIPDTFERTFTATTTRLLWETKFVGLVVLLAFIGWLPLTSTNTVHRLSQLISADQQHQQQQQQQQQRWPDLTTWLICELCILTGDFIVQFVILVMLLCESTCVSSYRSSDTVEDFALGLPFNSPPPHGRGKPNVVNDSVRVNSTLQDMESLQVSEFAASSQFSSALHCIPDSGVSSATAYTNNEKMEPSMARTCGIGGYFTSPTPNANNARALVSAEVSISYGSEDCGRSSVCLGGGVCSSLAATTATTANRQYELSRDGCIYPPPTSSTSSSSATSFSGAHETLTSPPPLPPPNYTYGFPSPVFADKKAYEGMKCLGNGVSPPEKLPCFRTTLPPLPPKGEDCEDFIDAGHDVDNSSEESGSRYFDQHGVLVSKL